jgi:pyruvate dehydrogenase E1 component alpha subunit
MKRYLKERFGVDDDTLEKVEERAQKAVDKAVEFAAASPEPDVTELYNHVFCKECANVQ